MSEATLDPAVARSRGGLPAHPRPPSRATVRAAMMEVPDPEIPVVSVIDLGMVEEITVDRAGIGVTLLPTFVGCPALDMIRTAVEDRLRAFGRPVRVRFDYRVPWTSDRITAQGRARLLASGFAPPVAVEADAPLLIQLATPVACPHCGSRRTTLENAFGPTQCRAIHQCTACRQPFESFKTI